MTGPYSVNDIRIGSPICEDAWFPEVSKALVEMGAESGERMSAYMDAPLIVGGSLQTVFVLFVLVFQLALVWGKE